MSTNRRGRIRNGWGDSPGRRRRLGGVLVAGLASAFGGGAGLGGEAGQAPGIRYYSTAEAPRTYRGPRPVLLALGETSTGTPDFERALDREVVRTEGLDSSATARSGAATSAEKEAVPRVASTAGRSIPAPAPLSNRPPGPQVSAPSAAEDDPIARAKQAIAACRARFAQVQDYSCTFHKRERIDGRLGAPHVMSMKARTQPHSIYFKFQRPNRGREAIYVAGRNGGKIIAHDVGLGKLVAGTMQLDPKGSMAMEDNRHPVTEAGIGSLIETVARHWAIELTPEESRIVFHPNVRVGNHACTMIESIHPRKRADFLYHTVKLYIDHEHGLPIRFEAYDWPKQPGVPAELLEEYTYLNLRTNVGLGERDFDPSNPQYSYGRF